MSSKRLGFCMLVLILGIVFMVNTASAVSLKIDPSLSTISQGDPVNISIGIFDFEPSQSLSAFDLDLIFDSSILSIGNVSFGNQLSSWGLGSYQETMPGSGTINLSEVSYESEENLNNHQVTSFSLAQLTFNTIGLGNNIPLTLSINDLGDAAGNRIIPSSVSNGSVTVRAPVPTPPVPPIPAQVPLSSGPISVLLLVAGLMSIVGVQRKFSAKA